MLNKFFLIFALVSLPSFGANPSFLMKNPFDLEEKSELSQDTDLLGCFDTTLNHTQDHLCSQNFSQSGSEGQSDKKIQRKILRRSKLPDLSELQLTDLEYSDEDTIEDDEVQIEHHRPKTKQILKSMELGESLGYLQPSQSDSEGQPYKKPQMRMLRKSKLPDLSELKLTDLQYNDQDNVDISEEEHEIIIIDLLDNSMPQYDWEKNVDDLQFDKSTSEANNESYKTQTFSIKWKVINNDTTQQVLAKFFKNIGSFAPLSVQQLLLTLQPAFQSENLKRKILISSKLINENEKLKLEILRAVKPYASSKFDKEEILFGLQELFNQIRKTQLQEELDLIEDSQTLYDEVLNKIAQLKQRKLYSFCITIETTFCSKVVVGCSWGLQKCPQISESEEE